MSVVIADGWRFEVDEGAEWLFLTLLRDGQVSQDEPAIAARGWSIAEERGKKHIVFELGPGLRLSSFVAGQLILMHKRAEMVGGRFRICAFPVDVYSTLKMMNLAERFPNYADRESAVTGRLPVTS